MKIYLMTDMEATAGILNHDDWVLPAGLHYAKGQRLLTGEINAAVDGFFAGGATEVLVVDGHGAGGIDPELLDERAKLQRGWADQVRPLSLDRSYAGIAWVGQHAKAGTPFSHITHSGWFDTIDMTVNGISIGEYGEMALCAKELGVPCFFAAGEQAFCEEAQALTPGVVTVAVKWGLKNDGPQLEALDMDSYRRAKLSAVHLAPAKARQVIREGAVQAMRKLCEQRAAFSFPELQPPFVKLHRFRARKHANGETPAHRTRAEHPTSLIALFNQPEQKLAD